MKILLIQPSLNWAHPWCEAPSTALLILGTLAQNKGHQVKILHLDIDQQQDISEVIKTYHPDIIGVTINTFEVKSARYIVKATRKISKDIKIVIGGPHAGVWDREADEVVIGEGENRWLETLGETPSINSINDVPPINYDLVDLRRFVGIGPHVGAVPSMCIMASRGCPNQCTFCNTPVFWGKKVRYRDAELVLDEVERLHRDYGMREIMFQDDTFNLNHTWASQIFEGLIRRGLSKEMIFRITGRVNEKLVTKEYLDLAYKAGVWNIFYGVESGSQYMLNRMKKHITVEEIKRAVRMTHEAHITTICSFIVGLPGESRQTLDETNRLIHEIKPYHYGWGFGCPFPKTEFKEEVIRKGHIQDKDYSEYTYGMLIVRTNKLSYEDLKGFKGFSYQGG